jgi:hypothetical protein
MFNLISEDDLLGYKMNQEGLSSEPPAKSVGVFPP